MRRRVIGEIAEFRSGALYVPAWLWGVVGPVGVQIAGDFPAIEASGTGSILGVDEVTIAGDFPAIEASGAGSVQDAANQASIAGDFPPLEASGAGTVIPINEASIAGDFPAIEASGAGSVQDPILDNWSGMFTGDGTYNWDGASGESLTFECWGQGGGSNGSNESGGGGAYAKKTVSSPSGSYAIVVPNSMSAGDNGADCTVASGSVCLAEGGTNGTGGGAGGLASNSVGDVKRDGGDGSGPTGGGSAGASSAASGQTPGDPDGALGCSSTADRTAPGAGAGTAGTAQTGMRAGCRVTRNVLRSTGYPAIRGRARTRSRTLQTATGVSIPSGETDDLIVVYCSAYCSGTADLTASGYTQRDLHHESSVVASSILLRKATGSDGCTVTMENAYLTAYVWRIHKDTWSGDIADIAGSITGGTSGNANPPAVSPGSSANRLWLAAATALSSATIDFRAAPFGYINFDEVPRGVATYSPHVAVGDKRANQSSENPGAFSSTGTFAYWLAAAIAIEPA